MFIIEAIIKIFVFGIYGYLQNDWNKFIIKYFRFDFFVVMASIFDLISPYLIDQDDSQSKTGSIIKLIRIFRIVRTLKLAKSMQGL